MKFYVTLALTAYGVLTLLNLACQLAFGENLNLILMICVSVAIGFIFGTFWPDEHEEKDRDRD